MNGTDSFGVSPEDVAFFRETFLHHKAHPCSDLNSYKSERRFALGHDLLVKKRIYLDTNHWLGLREIHIGRSQQKAYAELYRRLGSVVEVGNVGCPASFPCIIELFKQDDQKTRVATAQVIDRFSLGSV